MEPVGEFRLGESVGLAVVDELSGEALLDADGCHYAGSIPARTYGLSVSQAPGWANMLRGT